MPAVDRVHSFSIQHPDHPEVVDNVEHFPRTSIFYLIFSFVGHHIIIVFQVAVFKIDPFCDSSDVYYAIGRNCFV